MWQFSPFFHLPTLPVFAEVALKRTCQLPNLSELGLLLRVHPNSGDGFSQIQHRLLIMTLIFQAFKKILLQIMFKPNSLNYSVNLCAFYYMSLCLKKPRNPFCFKSSRKQLEIQKRPTAKPGRSNTRSSLSFFSVRV